MKYAIVFLISLLLNSIAYSYNELDILGRWEYVAYFYDGHRYEKMNPDLHVYFDFQLDGKMKLSWVRIEDNSHCERMASFRIEDENKIIQHIYWVDPNNSFECGQDPDMQLGQTTVTPFRIVDDELNLLLELNGQEFIYIIKKMPVEY